MRKLLAAIIAIALLTSCGGSPAAQERGKTLAVVASTSIIGDVVRQIGGDTIDVSTLVPLGGDAHSFEPTPQDIARLTTATLIFVNGAGYEGFIERMLNSAGSAATPIDLSQGITLRELSDEDPAHSADDDQHHAEGLDPHIWTNPLHVIQWTETIAAALSAADPANAATYAANATDYSAQLRELDTWANTQFAQLPAQRRLLVTDHAVFGYLADRYGLQQIGTILPGFSSSAAPAAQDLAALQRAIQEQNVPAIFVSSVVNQSLAEQLASDTGTDLLPVYTESLSPPDGPAPTYILYMRYNISTMVEALR